MSWNTRELLRACLDSLAADAEAGIADVWVVDNASNDGSAEMVNELFPWVTLIASKENLGFGRAVNLVGQRTSSEWIAPANADVQLCDGALAALLRVGEAEPGAGIVAPRLVLPDGRTQHSVYPFPTLPFTLVFNLGIPNLSPRLSDYLALEGRWDPERARVVDWAIGAFLLVRRTAWVDAGGFDSTQWMYAEDLDLGWRMHAHGWQTRFEPRAAVRHHSAAATSQLWGDERDVRWMRSTYAWMLARRGAAIMRAVALVNTLGAAIRLAAWTPAAVTLGGRWADRRRELRRWTVLHLANLLASRAKLRDHR